MSTVEKAKFSELRDSSKQLKSRKLVTKKLSSTLSVSRKNRAPSRKSAVSTSAAPPEARKQNNLDIIAAIQEQAEEFNNNRANMNHNDLSPLPVLQSPPISGKKSPGSYFVPSEVDLVPAAKPQQIEVVNKGATSEMSTKGFGRASLQMSKVRFPANNRTQSDLKEIISNLALSELDRESYRKD